MWNLRIPFFIISKWNRRMFVQWPGVLPGVCTVSLILFNPSFSLRFHHLRLSCSELLSILDPFNQWTVAHFNRKLRIFSNMFVTCATTQLPTFKPFLSSPTHDATLSHSTQCVYVCLCRNPLLIISWSCNKHGANERTTARCWWMVRFRAEASL